jgi:hypothetical protein
MKSLWILTAIFIVAFAALMGIWKFAAVPFVADVPTAATKVVASLLVVTALTERSLAAINAAVFGKPKKLLEADLRNLELDREHDVVPVEDFQVAANKVRFRLAEIGAEEESIRIAIGFAFAVLVSTAGVRALSALVMFDGANGLENGIQKSLAHIVDILVTAGLIAGGSNGLAELLKIIKEGLKPAPKLF